MRAGVCPTPFCGAIRVSFPACPPGVCPPGSVPLEPVDGIADLFTKTITFAPQASSATGPTAGPYPNRAVRMTSTAPVTVATQVLGPQSADAGTAFSISSLASNYTFASREAGYSWQFAMIIAGASPVTITIPSLPYPALPFTGQGPQTFTLQPYDTYYIRTAGTEEHYNGGDLTGMQLQGTGPFAVIAGVNCANVPQGTYMSAHTQSTTCALVQGRLPVHSCHKCGNQHLRCIIHVCCQVRRTFVSRQMAHLCSIFVGAVLVRSCYWTFLLSSRHVGTCARAAAHRHVAPALRVPPCLHRHSPRPGPSRNALVLSLSPRAHPPPPAGPARTQTPPRVTSCIVRYFVHEIILLRTLVPN